MKFQEMLEKPDPYKVLNNESFVRLHVTFVLSPYMIYFINCLRASKMTFLNSYDDTVKNPNYLVKKRPSNSVKLNFTFSLLKRFSHRKLSPGYITWFYKIFYVDRYYLKIKLSAP